MYVQLVYMVARESKCECMDGVEIYFTLLYSLFCIEWVSDIAQ